MFVNKLINKGYLNPFQRQAKAYCDEFEDEKGLRALSHERLDFTLSFKTPAVCLCTFARDSRSASANRIAMPPLSLEF
jgi:hypothetical protein